MLCQRQHPHLHLLDHIDRRRLGHPRRHRWAWQRHGIAPNVYSIDNDRYREMLYWSMSSTERINTYVIHDMSHDMIGTSYGIYLIVYTLQYIYNLPPPMHRGLRLATHRLLIIRLGSSWLFSRLFVIELLDYELFVWFLTSNATSLYLNT